MISDHTSVIKLQFIVLRLALHIALRHALLYAPRPFLHCVFAPCLVSLILLRSMARLSLRLALSTPLAPRLQFAFSCAAAVCFLFLVPRFVRLLWCFLRNILRLFFVLFVFRRGRGF